MKVRKERRLNENTKLNLTIGMFVFVILFFVTAVYGATSWKSDTDYTIDENIRINLLQQIEINELSEKIEEQNNMLIKLVTDVEWIRKDMEDKE